MDDQTSNYRHARFSLYFPPEDGGNARYALLVNEVVRGIPRGSIFLDGVLPSAPARPTLEEMLVLFDSALAREMLTR